LDVSQYLPFTLMKRVSALSPPGWLREGISSERGRRWRKRRLPRAARSRALISPISAGTALRATTLSRVQSPCLKLPLRSPWGPRPSPLSRHASGT
jgi:hypothetical protein